MEKPTFKDKIKPILRNTTIAALQGYAFGGIVGIITNKNNSFSDTFCCMHKNGMEFGKLGAMYKLTEEVAKLSLGDRKSNVLVASAVSGFVVKSKTGFKAASVAGLGFMVYNGFDQIYGMK